MKSVDATRVMPSLCATSAATVDLPVPVEPPISTMIGTSSPCRSASRRRRPTTRSPSSSPRVSCAIERNRSRSTVRLPRPARSSSTRTARPYARSAGTPAAISARAITPFEYGRSALPSGSGSPWRFWVIPAPSPEGARATRRRARRRRRRSRRARSSCRSWPRAPRRRRSPRPSARPGTCRRRS